MFASTDMSSDGVGVSVFRVMDGGAYFYRERLQHSLLCQKMLNLKLVPMLRK